ncbi:hypothetical protein NPIL_98491 [Nephila pilipes]|uniref:Uncharacterized protein n=1 Tax=Nephila pilipes TaxID=299642 RepID=A0A8X6J6R1_NEPPI|nr:hypothetical protein NPIL_98491 [Nephila pilipes]
MGIWNIVIFLLLSVTVLNEYIETCTNPSIQSLLNITTICYLIFKIAEIKLKTDEAINGNTKKESKNQTIVPGKKLYFTTSTQTEQYNTRNEGEQTKYHQTESSTQTENLKETNNMEMKCKQENSPIQTIFNEKKLCFTTYTQTEQNITANSGNQTKYYLTETCTQTENLKETNSMETKYNTENIPSPAAIEIKTITRESKNGENNYQQNTEIFAENLTNSNSTKTPFLNVSNLNEEDNYFSLSSLTVKSSSSNSDAPVQKNKKSVWKKLKKIVKKIKTS